MNNRRDFIKSLSLGLFALSSPDILKAIESSKQKLNILLFTADDLNCDSVGCYGGSVPDISPNMDKFASEGMLFKKAHVNVAICMPSRGVLGTGRYGHNSGMMGFWNTKMKDPDVMESFKKNSYLTGILGKVAHSTPKEDFRWDFDHYYGELGAGRDPEKYYGYCREFFDKCKAENKPFYFMVNSHDPHRPFHDPANPKKKAAAPSRLYKPDEIEVPGFLPDLPGVRNELAHYYNSVRRCDDTFGRVMDALRESGFQNNTLVMFLSDNGIAMPFAKANVYLASTRTPWIVRYPGVTEKGAVNDRDFISGVDFYSTVMDAAKLPIPSGMDGKSFLPLLKGEKQSGRDIVFTQIDRAIGGPAIPMRCVQNERYGYIFNAWSDGKFRYSSNNEGKTMEAMNKAAVDDPAIARRVKMYRKRVMQEFYDMQKDPDCLNNLIENPDSAPEINTMIKLLEDWMRETNDPLLEAFVNRESPEVIKSVLDRIYTGDGIGTKPKMP